MFVIGLGADEDGAMVGKPRVGAEVCFEPAGGTRSVAVRSHAQHARSNHGLKSGKLGCLSWPDRQTDWLDRRGSSRAGEGPTGITAGLVRGLTSAPGSQ